MIKIYHNNRCSKSREVLSLLEKSGISFQVIDYTKQTFSKNEIKRLLKKIGVKADELIRKNEKDYKEHMKNRGLSEEQIIEAMSNNYKLIQRPLLEKESKAIVARPLEEAIKFIKN